VSRPPSARPCTAAAGGLAVLAAALLGGCAGGEDPETEALEREFAKRARLREGLDLPAGGDREVHVTVVGVRGVAHGPTGVRGAAGRLVGVHVVLRNEEDRPYTGAPVARLQTAGRRWLAPADDAAGGRCLPPLRSPVTLAPAATRRVCVVFRLPDARAPRRFRLALVSRAEAARRTRRPPRRVSRRFRPPKPAKSIRAGEWLL
jgi:hypothetical protein